MANSRSFGSRKGQTTMGVAKQEVFNPTVIDYSDMPVRIQTFAIEQAENAIRQLNKNELRYYSDCAEQVRKAMEEEFHGTFHVIVGRSFGSYFSYESGYCI